MLSVVAPHSVILIERVSSLYVFKLRLETKASPKAKLSNVSVRESSSMALAALLMLMTSSAVSRVIEMLLKLIQHQEWQSRHGGVLALKHYLSMSKVFFALTTSLLVLIVFMRKMLRDLTQCKSPKWHFVKMFGGMLLVKDVLWVEPTSIVNDHCINTLKHSPTVYLETFYFLAKCHLANWRLVVCQTIGEGNSIEYFHFVLFPFRMSLIQI